MSIGIWAWLLMAGAALVVGISKTSISGLGSLVVAAFALVLPAKESTAAVLLLLICGDIVAVILYHHAADWHQLKRLLPAVVPGIALGAVFMKFVSDEVLLVSVAGCLIAAVALQIGLRVRDARASAALAQAGTAPAPPASARPAWVPALLAGVAAGFTTMVANAAGAVMSLYLLAIKADKTRFVATGAWFFFLVNLTKVPFSIGLGLIHLHTLAILATLIPVVLLGTWVGRHLLKALKQTSFEWLVIAASLLSAVVLLLKGVL